MYLKKSLRKYLDDLAARKPAPGGGSAAAAAASLGVSLMAMVANYTIGNPRYAAVERRMHQMLGQIEDARSKLQKLIDDDVAAYTELSKGMKEKPQRPARLQGLYRRALRPPYEICLCAAAMLRLCKELTAGANKNLITDVAIAAIFLEGAFFAAKYNVYINLKYITDTKTIESIHARLAPLEEEMPHLKEEILEMCEDALA